VIGLGATGVLGLVSVGLLAAAGGLALDRAGAFDSGPGATGLRASATVLDVDSTGDSGIGFDYSVDVEFPTADGTEVAWVDWPDDDAPPRVGDEVEVSYDSFDPDWLEIVSDQEGPADAGAADSGSRPGVVAAWGGGFSALTLAVLVTTVVWARRAPKPERPGPFGSYGYPPPYGYPGYVYGPHPYGYAGQPYAPQPYAQQPYATQPYAHPQHYAYGHPPPHGHRPAPGQPQPSPQPPPGGWPTPR
jgi:hypothetical protein